MNEKDLSMVSWNVKALSKGLIGMHEKKEIKNILHFFFLHLKSSYYKNIDIHTKIA